LEEFPTKVGNKAILGLDKPLESVSKWKKVVKSGERW